MNAKEKKAWVKKMAKARKAANKKRKGGSSSPSLIKYSSRKKLEQRIADLEIWKRELIEAKKAGLASESDLRELDAAPRLLKESRKKLDAGDW
jgi:hypothetical protein